MAENSGGMQAPMSRKSFLGWFIAAVGGVVTAALALPGLSYAVAPALTRRQIPWTPIGRVDEFEVGEPKLVPFSPPGGDAWLKQAAPGAVYVVKKGEEEFVVFDIRCTHLGCPVQWNRGARRYFSPCHGGVFDEDGRVVSGPPPRPLDRYRTKVEGGKLYIGGLYQVQS